jgi:hypothetical protein
VSDAATDRTKNPYAAPRRAAEPDYEPRRGVLPVLRLRRLGASDRMVRGMGELWQRMDQDEREAMADEMAGMDDDALIGRLVGDPPDGDVDTVAEWVEGHPFSPDAARLAIAAERAKAVPSLAAVDRYARAGQRQ